MPGFTLPDPPEPLAAKPVRAWSQPVVIPTYEPMPADKNPMFLEKRVYQGSSGKVYPLPFIDRISTTKTDRAWQAIHIENQYVRLMILPELGGRIHVGLDKTNNYDFFYRQNVIKPALVGLAGPWISGGVEFNWPQHHRPSTFMPVDTHIEEHADGSVTVWCSEHEPMTRMKGMHGIHLKPGSSLIELKVRLYNRTELPQTFLWWANVAARVHEHYQSFFPPDVQYVADHAKRAMSRFPLCDGTYYGVDYESVARRGNARQNASPANEPSDYFQGTAPHFPPANYPPNDLTRYANIPVPTSYMILGTKEDFFGGYDHHAQAGFVHVADHHIAPGKKQWTWGNHPFGYAWDRHLTDPEDPTDTAPPYRRHLPAPYIELMAGVFTDNQPDFSWLMPGETRTFSQFWYPIQKIGPVIAANQQCAMSLIALESSNRMTDPPSRGSGDQKVAHDKPTAVGAVVGAIPNSPGEPRQGRQNASSLRAIAIKIGLVVTTKLSNARLTLHHAHDTIAEWPNLELAPGQSVFHEAPIPDGVHLNDLQISLHANHHEILSYQPAPPTKKETPEPAQEPPLPQDAKTNEDLYLIGLHLDQYRHATRMPEDYWREALKRDPHDSRCNNALGLYHLRRGEFEKAVTHFQTAIASLTQYNPNPRDGEVFYNLGITLRHLRRTDEAYEAFGKAQWNETWKASACFAMAEIDWSSSRDNRGKQALANVNKTLHAQPDHLQARHLKIEIIGLGAEESNAIRDQTRRLDPLDSAGQSEPECGWQTVLDSVYDLLKSRNLQDAYILMMRAGLPQANMSGDLDNPLGEWRKPPQIGGEHEVGVTPMIWYLAAFIWGFWEKGDPLQQDRARRAQQNFLKAASAAPADYCFPHRLEEIAILQFAIDKNPSDPRAPYYLGNLFYDKRRHEEAITLWEKSARLDPTFPTVWRNLGIGYYNILHDPLAAKGAYHRAFKASLTQNIPANADPDAPLDDAGSGDARILYERDQLWKRTAEPPAKRLAELENYPDLIHQRDDLTLEYCSLLNQTGDHDRALQILKSRHFQPWEGGEGLALAQWTRTHLALARKSLWLAPAEGGGGGDPQHALELLHAALTPSENLGEAFHLLQNNSELHYWSALAARAVGNIQLATQHFETAAASITDFQRMAVTAYSEATLWSGLALRELHRHPEARALFEAVLAHAHHLKSTPAKIDYFATSLPTMLIFDEDIQQSQLHRATLLEALALYGLNTSTDRKTARRLLNDLLLADPNHTLAADLLIALDWSP